MPGETAVVGETAALKLDIRCHKPLSKVILIVDGRKFRTIPLGGGMSYRADLALPLKGKKWIIVYAEGVKNYAYGYTNPIYIR